MAAVAEDTDIRSDRSDIKTRKIIIIGAGIAGLSTAHHLIKNGEHNFMILEARNRLGGRIISIPMGDQVVDLGAGWIHGVLDNPVYELAVSNGLVNITNDQQPHAIVATTEEGKRVPISIIEEVYSAYFWFSKRCEEYFVLHLHPPPQVDSVGKHLEADISAYLQQYQGSDADVRRMVFDHLLSRETCITGCHDMNETGLSDFGSYSELPGGNISIPSGFHSIINYLADILPEENITLQSPVKYIQWKVRKKSDQAEAQNGVTIECEDGSVWQSNHLVVTLPLGVLKEKANEMFNPKLPEYKLECFNNLCFGVVNKIFLEYDRPFLNSDISEVITLWKRTDEKDISQIWHRKVFSFSRYKENILVAWISGLEAEYLETLTDDQVADTCTEILRKFLNDPYVPKPCRVVSTSWKSHPYSRGSYTYIGIKGSQRDIELLAKPIYNDPYHNKPVLMFAGEATHSTFYSTTHGAYLTGIKCAEILLEPESDSKTPANKGGDESNKDLSSWIRGIDLN